MDLETIRAANRIGDFQEGQILSSCINEQLEQLAELSYEEKEKLMAKSFGRALIIAEVLVGRPEYDEETRTLDLSAQGLGKVNLDVYHDDGDEDTKPFDGIYVDVGGVYAQHSSIGELHDEMIYVRRDGSVEQVYDDFDRHVHAALEYLETLEVIQSQFALQLTTT
jgi:hypothetical protein